MDLTCKSRDFQASQMPAALSKKPERPLHVHWVLVVSLSTSETRCHIRSWRLGHLPFINWVHGVFVCS